VDALDDAASFHRDHLGEKLLDALGGTPSQVAFAALGAYHDARPGDPKALRSGLMGLQLILGGCLLAWHVYFSFSHKTPFGLRLGGKAPNLDRFGAWTHGKISSL